MHANKLLIFCVLTILAGALLACSSSKKTSSPSTTAPLNSTVSGLATQLSGVATQLPSAVNTIAGGLATVVPTLQTGTGVGDACKLLSKQDVSTALGEAVKDPDGTSVGSQPFGLGLSAAVASCSFDSMTSTKSVEVELWKISGGSASQVKQLGDTLVCGGKEKINGLADSACWYDSNHRELQMFKGTTFVSISILETAGPDRAAAIQSLAAKALAALF